MTRLRSPRPLPDIPAPWIIETPVASIEPPRPWAELPLPMWDQPPPAPEEETAPTGGTVVIFDI